MASLEKVYEYVVVNDNTPIQKLPLLDLIRVIIKELSKNIGSQLDNEGEINKELMTLQANLYDFLEKATDPIREGTHYAVAVQVPSLYTPVWKEVLNNDLFTKHYNVTVFKPDMDYDLPFNYTILFEVVKN